MSSDQLTFLHGDLDLKIVEAKHLPNMDLFSERLRRCFTACDSCSTPPQDYQHDPARDSQIGHKHNPRIITSDAYVTVSVPQATVARTRVIKNARTPKWNESFRVQLAHQAAHLEFQVKDDDVFGSQLIGTVYMPAEKILSGEHIADWFPVVGPSGKPPKPDSALYLDLKFTPCDKNPLYKHGIASDPEHKGVRNTYFPLRKGCSVKLYQDAHASHDVKMPEIKLDGGRVYQQGHCWEDICYAISEAHHLIYIVGWSIFHKVKLVREPTRPLPRGGNLTLGELLKYKSQEGVRVLLLVWDDKTSHDKLLIKTAGVMATHDEETKKFFKHSSVNCVLSPRYASSKLGYLKQQVVGTVFTHHQKCVLVDTQASGNDRRVTAFLGGLDMCDGRYDTPEHRLFRDLDTVFQDDFHNPTFPAGTKAPRQPWHDLHSRVDGPAAYDVLINFEQRWRKATKWTELSLRLKKVSHWHDDAMIKIDRISWILSPSVPKDGTTSTRTTTTIPEDDPALWVSREDNPENWHVQVGVQMGYFPHPIVGNQESKNILPLWQIFRSIDSGSVKGFPTFIDVAKSQNLMCSKNVVIDRSIQTAYVQAIRSAQHFIYIENQYFLGSSYAWPSYDYAGADNLVPMELALKITSKIRAKERFAVYIVIPMWPEGDTNSGPVQEILFWQNQTMQMMYGVIAQELKNMQLDSDPQDYLNFYCLGNREKLPEEKLREHSESSANGVKISDSEKHQRFMIYVHAKGMIVDDEYVLIGSANINQRSLAGTKDTELAMGAYQPHYTRAEKKRLPRGQIYGYRMSLWAEHLGVLESCVDEPESLDCVKTVNRVAEENWARFNVESFTPLQGHLLKYPVKVDKDGNVGPLPGSETFPDVGGKIVGTYSTTIPDVLTT